MTWSLNSKYMKHKVRTHSHKVHRNIVSQSQPYRSTKSNIRCVIIRCYSHGTLNPLLKASKDATAYKTLNLQERNRRTT